MLWNIHGRPPDRLHLLGYLFAPTFACTVFGQISSFVLLGVVGFLYWHRRRPFLAGMCIALLALKPQVLLPFGLVLLVWIVVRRRYWVLLGAIVGIAMATAVPLWFRPSIWSDYLPIFHAAVADSVIIPTISTLVRIGIAPHTRWLQFVPAILGGIWAIGYFTRYRTQWDWNRHGPLLLLVSVFVAPYSWFPDEVVVLPAMLAAVYCCAERDRSLLGFAILDVAALLLIFARRPSAVGRIHLDDDRMARLVSFRHQRHSRPACLIVRSCHELIISRVIIHEERRHIFRKVRLRYSA